MHAPLLFRDHTEILLFVPEDHKNLARRSLSCSTPTKKKEMMTMVMLLVIGASAQVLVPAVPKTTWTSQSPYLPSYEWVGLDHADGNSMGYGITTTSTDVYVAGTMKRIVRIENPVTGTFVETDHQDDDGDVYVAAVGLDGEPRAVWTFDGSDTEVPTHLSTSPAVPKSNFPSLDLIISSSVKS